MSSGFLVADYEATVVCLSVAIATYSSFVALELVRHVRACEQPREAMRWLVLGGLALGTGIWTMHFVGMLAFRLPLALGYRAPLTLLSWLAAVSVSFVALWVATRSIHLGRIALGALVVAVGICAMHYLGMAAIDLAPPIVWSVGLVAASVAIAVAASTAALVLFCWLPARAGRGSFSLQALAAAAMGLAISGMHYTGMAAANFPLGAICLSADAISGERIGLPIAAICTALLIGFDSYLHARNQRSERLAASLIAANAELRQARDAADAANRAKGDFLANMSHEVRTPMNAIIGLTDLVLQTPLDTRQRDFLEKVHGSSTALLTILNDILDYSKIEAGRMQIESVPFSIEQPLTSVANLFGALVEQRGLELLFEIAPDVPMQVRGDPLRVTQVLNNLVGNAIKFTPSGSIHVKIDVAASRGDSLALRVAVHDTGIGLSDQQAAQLFDAFTQGDESVTRRYGGTGLGLSISRRLVQMMGGTIAVRGALGRGSCFTFTLDVGRVGEPREFDVQRLERWRVLVVDDQEISCVVLRNLCQSWGMHIDTASSGAEGLVKVAAARADGRRFDVLLVDWKMPGMSGIEMLRRLRETEPADALPLAIMVTAYSQAQLLRDAGEMPIDAVLIKPIVPSALFNVLLRLGPKRSDAEAAVAAPRAGPRVLLVEDNQINQLLAREYLHSVGIEPVLANNGREAIELSARLSFDLVLMDLHMPEVDGFEATRVIRGRGPNGPQIVAISAAVMEDDRRRAAVAGMVDFIAKPITTEALLRSLHRWLAPWDETPIVASFASPAPGGQVVWLDQRSGALH